MQKMALMSLALAANPVGSQGMPFSDFKSVPGRSRSRVEYSGRPRAGSKLEKLARKGMLGRCW